MSGSIGYIATYSGQKINPLDPDPDAIKIIDIAHSLSNQCRYTGHVKEFYSVATHSVLCTLLVPDEDQLWALLHDASEAYLSDIARPVKKGLGFGQAYMEVEERLMECIADRFDLPWPMPESVHEADNAMLWSEATALMPDAFWELESDTPKGSRVPFPIYGEKPLIAKERFLQQYAFLASQR